MKIDKNLLSNMLISSASLLKQNCEYLSEIDSKFGDGDHGITINKIAVVIENEVSNWKDESIHNFIENLGDKIMAVNGGSAGPLYGTMIGGMAVSLTDEIEIDAPKLKTMFKDMLSEMQSITTAKIGDKTMMDALIPAVNAALNSSDDIKEILEAAANAAVNGANESKKFISKYGRAKSYKEQTIGTPDAGAVSTSIFFKGLCQ